MATVAALGALGAFGAPGAFGTQGSFGTPEAFGTTASPGATSGSPPDVATSTATASDLAASGLATTGPAATTDRSTVPGGERLLVVEDAETGERLLAVPVAEGTTVALNYTHSVEKTPVLDVYAVDGTELEMVRMEFRSYGAGLPARADVTVTENDTFVFDPEGSYEELYVTPGPIAGHELVVGDRVYDLVDLSDARTVKLSVAADSTTTASRTTWSGLDQPT